MAINEGILVKAGCKVAVAVRNAAGVLNLIPSPSSLSTSSALAVCVFFSVPLFNIAGYGIAGYFKSYLEPSGFMAPSHLITELSRTVALAVPLFGNMMSGEVIEELHRRYHRLRQSSIDEELFDVISGSETLAKEIPPTG